MSEWRRELVHTNCNQYCANPHHYLENLRGVLLENSTTNQSSLVLCSYRSVIVVSSQIRVPFRRVDLAACFGELTHFFICQDNTCIELHPLVPFGASRLSEGSLHIGRAGWEVKSFFSVLLLQHFLPVAIAHSSHSHLKKSISLMFAMPFWNRNETSCSVSTPFHAVLACFEDRSSCSCVSSEGLD